MNESSVDMHRVKRTTSHLFSQVHLPVHVVVDSFIS